MMYIAILAAFCGIYTAESATLMFQESQPQPCCFPDQWTGKIGENVGYNSPRGQGAVFGYSEATYDFTNKRMAVNKKTYSAENKVKSEKVIILDKKMYLINEDKQKCFVASLKEGLRQACIPKNAKSTGEMTFGLGSNSLKGDGWMFFVKSRRMAGSVSLTVTPDCVPIGQITAGKVGRRGNFGFLSNAGFFNISAGVKDPSVFDIPKSCDKGYDIENAPEDLQVTSETFSYLYE